MRVAKVRLYETLDEFQTKLNKNLRDGWDLHSWTCEPLEQKRGDSFQLYRVVYMREPQPAAAPDPKPAKGER